MRASERIPHRRVAGNINDRELYYQTYTGQLTKAHNRNGQDPTFFNRSLQHDSGRSMFEASRNGLRLSPSSSEARAKPSSLLMDCSELSRFDKHPQDPIGSRFDAFQRSKISVPQQPRMYLHDYQHQTRHLPPKAAGHNPHVHMLSSPNSSPTNHSRSHDHYSSLKNLPSMEAFRITPQQTKHKMGPVIFLDIDGVVHPVQVTREYQFFRRDKMSLLRHLVQQSNAQIVLSSAWRLAPRTMAIVNQQLVRHGIDKVIDKTLDLGYAGKRSAEILLWVKQNEPSAWIAIDDIDLAADESRLHNHFIHTNSQVGLTAEQCEQGLRLLRMGA